MINKTFQELIKEVDINKVEEYDDTKERGNFLTGVRLKKFLRFESNIFEDLIDEIINNPNCHYITYMNELIKDGYIPKYISVLQKRDSDLTRNDDEFSLGHFKDVLASRVLNFFGCPTTYEALLNVGREMCVCSVDFVKYGEELYNINTIPLIQSMGAGFIEENIEALKGKLEWFCKHKNIKDNKDKMMEMFVEDYIYSRLVREYIVGDIDGGFHNMGLIHNLEENSIRFAPNFDLEYSFIIRQDTTSRCKEIMAYQEDLQFVKLNYPHIFNKFVKTLHTFVSKENGKPVFQNLIESIIGKSKKSKDFISVYGENIDQMLQIADDIADKKIMA